MGYLQYFWTLLVLSSRNASLRGLPQRPVDPLHGDGIRNVPPILDSADRLGADAGSFGELGLSEIGQLSPSRKLSRDVRVGERHGGNQSIRVRRRIRHKARLRGGIPQPPILGFFDDHKMF